MNETNTENDSRNFFVCHLSIKSVGRDKERNKTRMSYFMYELNEMALGHLSIASLVHAPLLFFSINLFVSGVFHTMILCK